MCKQSLFLCNISLFSCNLPPFSGNSDNLVTIKKRAIVTTIYSGYQTFKAFSGNSGNYFSKKLRVREYENIHQTPTNITNHHLLY